MTGLKPRLRITAPTGATVTATFQSDDVTLEEVEEGIFEADVDKLAPWTVTATDGIDTASKTVVVDDVGRFLDTILFATEPDGETLNDCSWANISQISSEGNAANYWEVGDTKAIALNGTCGTLALNTTLYCYILGFDHNSAKEGTGIHFGTWKTSASGGADVCLVDDTYDTNAGATGAKKFALNHWGNASSSPYNTNYGGWKGCDARYDILGSTNTAPSGYGSTPTTSRVGYDAPTNTATSPVANTLMSCLPSELRAVMKPITKYTNNVGNGNNTDAGVSSSVDYLPLLAEFEIFGARSYANEYEQNYQAQYTYYSSGNSKVKYKHNATTTTANWWERSPLYSNANGFCLVNTNGDAYNDASRYSIGLAPIFMV